MRVIEELRAAPLHYTGREEANSQQQESRRSRNAIFIVEAGPAGLSMGDGDGELQREGPVDVEGIEVGLREGTGTPWAVQLAQLITAPGGDGVEVGRVKAYPPVDRPSGGDGAADQRTLAERVGNVPTSGEVRVAELDG